MLIEHTLPMSLSAMSTVALQHDAAMLLPFKRSQMGVYAPCLTSWEPVSCWSLRQMNF